MKKYVIVTDSCSDLDKATRDKYEINYIPMRVLYEDKDIPADLDWGIISFEDFYKSMREGVRFKTAQINAQEYLAEFEKYISEGCDILSISCSSALSNSYNGSLIARDELKEKYPDAEIICIDSKNSCWGLGNLCLTASKLRFEGKSLKETAEYIEANKQRMNQFCTVESLTYFKRAGRVSATTAVFGGLLQVKPIVISDLKGQNLAVEKVKGRKNSLNKIIDMYVDAYEKDPYQHIVVVHADCLDEANYLKQELLKKLPDEEIEIQKLGPIIGATAGPGTVAIFGYGTKVKQ